MSEIIVIPYEGPPFRPPGWDNPHNPHYPVPEAANFGFLLFLFLFLFFVTRRHR